MADWLELELAERLTPVEAPGELWERICFASPAVARGPASRRPVSLVLAAAALLAGVAWLALPGTQRRPAVRPGATAESQSCALCHNTL